MPIGLQITLPDGTVRAAALKRGVLTLALDAVNNPERTYAQVSLSGGIRLRPRAITRERIADLQAELAALEAWKPDDR
jgi:hypothetical protein